MERLHCERNNLNLKSSGAQNEVLFFDVLGCGRRRKNFNATSAALEFSSLTVVFD
jgi:hypothetical protein